MTQRARSAVVARSRVADLATARFHIARALEALDRLDALEGAGGASPPAGAPASPVVLAGSAAIAPSSAPAAPPLTPASFPSTTPPNGEGGAYDYGRVVQAEQSLPVRHDR
jgi:hypothetical protein